LSNYSLVCACGSARAGELATAHGIIQTPVFMPVGSQATVKTLTPDEITKLGAGIILANNYHLYLRPGIEVIAKLGGLHRFMGWNGAILTDSGGYQVFSLSALTKVSDDGVAFRSHIDGSSHFLTPEKAILLQEALGSDIAMVLDEMSPPGAPLAKVEQAMKRTHRWAERCLSAHKKESQQLFAIVQGGLDANLRRHSAEYLRALNFSGYAIGGLSIGEPKEAMWEVVKESVAVLPVNKPRYLMGVGSPEDIVKAVSLGVDMMDCVLPTRVARNGALFTWNGRINIRNSIYRDLDEPIDRRCDCYTCTHFSVSYLRHLFVAQELLAYRLATIHNLRFLACLIRDLRESIISGAVDSFIQEFFYAYKTTDEGVRLAQKEKWVKARSLGVKKPLSKLP